MVWNKNNPAGATKIKDSDDEIRANFAAIETVLGTNITAGPTTIQDAILGDGTKGRQLRGINCTIDNGANAATLKCTVYSRWNGDTIAETDNIAKDATTGDFSLTATGKFLNIEASGLTGNVIWALGSLQSNASGTVLTALAFATTNDIQIRVYNASTAAQQDLTTLVDTGIIIIEILYITDA